MQQVVGIRFRRAGKIYYYEPKGLTLGLHDHVIAPTQRGAALGWVVIAPQDVVESRLREELQPVLRRADDADQQRLAQLKAKEQAALAQAKDAVHRSNLPIKLIRAEYALDEGHLTIFFAAENRVDFRDLARDLGAQLNARVELQQLGPREHAKLLGGYGWCGQELCCSRWLVETSPVTIKMAKDQGLPLNPSKLAGNCGRLRCCLRYEVETYLALRQRMPRVGQYVITAQGTGRVRTMHILKETVGVVLDEGGLADVKASEVKIDEARTNAARARAAAPPQRPPATSETSEPAEPSALE